MQCVALINDTVGCLMSCAFHHHDTYIGVIIGKHRLSFSLVKIKDINNKLKAKLARVISLTRLQAHKS